MARMAGRLIVLEGIDGSGKGTQFNLLKERFSSVGDVRTLDFPRYDSYFGRQIGRYLRGEFGSLEEVPVELPILLYALDRYETLPVLEDWLSRGFFVLLNRYTTSSMAYQAAKFEGLRREEILDWIELVEARLPKPDLVVLLDVPEDIAGTLVLKKKKRNYLGSASQDIHERDVSYQERVASLYRSFASSRPEWAVVKCSDEKRLLSPQEVSERVWKVVSERLKLE